MLHFFSGKLSKTVSRAQVPDLISTIKSVSNPKSHVPVRSASTAAVMNHRRSASDSTNRLSKNKSSTSVDVALKKTSLRDVKPRYLEPKKPSAPRDTALHVRNRSSSGSSRTSSPCISTTRRQEGLLQGGKKALSDSITMSRDSLASPAKKMDKASRKNASQENNERLSVDSLGGSMHSSIITNQTHSQESLVHNMARVGGLNVVTTVAGKEQQRFRPSAPLKSNTASSVNSSTPSSISTLKSRLSANSSISSPRDGVKCRLTTPANPNPISLTGKSSSKSSVKSFLSARSRQILAQKKALSHSDSSKSVPAVIKEKSLEIHNPVNKSSSTSNMLARPAAQQRKPTKPSPAVTAQHPPAAAKTSVAAQHSLMNPTKSSAMKMVAQNNKTNREHSNREAKKKPTKDTDGSSNDESAPTRIESKLERSSTFCKERSELPNAELQIID